jgi:hypothetical protein
MRYKRMGELPREGHWLGQPGNAETGINDLSPCVFKLPTQNRHLMCLICVATL